MSAEIKAVFDYRTMAEWDWVVLPSWGALHRGTFDADDITLNTDWCGGEGETACGRRGFLTVPGFITRMGAPRCKRCCAAMGYPQGKGSPKNDEACRPLVAEVLSRRILVSWREHE